MKIRFLNQTITILQSDKPIPYPYYDINYAYKSIIISTSISITENVDKELLNEIILKGCFDITMRDYNGILTKANPLVDYIISKIYLLNDVYEIEEGKKDFKFKNGGNNDGK